MALTKDPNTPIFSDVKLVREAKQTELHHTEHGYEIVSPLPMAPPVGYKKSPTLAEQIRAMIISEKLRQEAEAAGFETFEEADDFDVGDDFDPTSPYEGDFDPLPPPPPVPVADRQQQAPEGSPATPPAGAGAPAPEGSQGPQGA